MTLTQIYNGPLLHEYRWAAYQDYHGYYENNLYFHQVGDDVWAAGTTDNETWEFGKLASAPTTYRKEHPGEDECCLGEYDYGCFSDLVEELTGVEVQRDTYQHD